MLITIKCRWKDTVIFEGEFESTKQAVEKAVEQNANLRGANLRGADLRDANLGDANLRGANLRGADLRDANLGDANLRGADLRGADLRGADLGDANLRGANLRDANLRGADLGDANLRDADLGDANLRGADLEPIKLDFIYAILKLPKEIPNLRQKFIDGKINGSTYEGECACLAGTIANHIGVKYTELPEKFKFPVNSSSLREKFAYSVKKGDTPENSQVAAFFVEWIDEALAMIDNIREA